jgi:hypothetical protein
MWESFCIALSPKLSRAPANPKKVVPMKTNSSSCLLDTRWYQQVDLVANMYFQMEKAGANIVLAALEPKTCVSIFDVKAQMVVNQLSRRCTFSCDKVLESLTRIIDADERLRFFFDISLTVVCGGMRIDGDKLMLRNLRVVNVPQSLIRVYYPRGSMQGFSDRFGLFGFYELQSK